jgi:hypothetical protein
MSSGIKPAFFFKIKFSRWINPEYMKNRGLLKLLSGEGVILFNTCFIPDMVFGGFAHSIPGGNVFIRRYKYFHVFPDGT